MRKPDSDGRGLSVEALRACLAYDPLTGIFTAKSTTGHRGRHKAGRVVGGVSKQSGYVRISVAGRLYQAHILAWVYVHGEWPVFQIDHRDTVRSHNWLSNLRPATPLQNGQNRRSAAKNSKSGILGVSWSKSGNAWVSYIKAGAVREYLGLFESKDEAANAYQAAKARLHPFAQVAR